MILIDTHVWVWLNSAPEKLSSVAMQLLESASSIGMSSISIYETLVALEKGRIMSTVPPAALVQKWLNSVDVTRIPVGDEVVFHSRSLGFLHEDPFDRIIASTGFHEKAPLMTADRNLLRLEWLATIPAQ